MAKSKGIEVRHQRTCRTRNGGKRCNCEPSYRAGVWDPRTRTTVRKSTKNLAEAESWHSDAQAAMRRGTFAAPSPINVREAAEVWLSGAREGSIRNRSGDRFKPSTLRGYERALRLRVLPAVGGRRLSDLRRADVQDLVDSLLAEDANASSIRNTLDPLRAIYRRAVSRDQVAVNPTAHLELPANRGRRDRVIEQNQALRLVAALPDGDRALWATALYAGLRRGELLGLRWEDIDLPNRVIRVERGWDDVEAEIDVKTRAGRRTVPIIGDLRRELAAHKLRTGRDGTALVFGSTTTIPFHPTGRGFRKRIAEASKAAGVGPSALTLHECRHTFASFAIAAGVNTKTLSTIIGHASVMITLDRYGHLFPGSEAEAGGQLDTYLARAGGE
jgi:integrase